MALLLIVVCSLSVVAWQGSAQSFPPVITVPPSNRVSSIGGSATFSVTATGSNLVYRWRKDGAALLSGTNRLLSLINLSNGNVGAYAVVVTNFYGSVTSQPAMLTLTGAPPRIFLHPTNSLLCPGGVDTILRVQSSGSPPFTYQWLREGIALAGQTFATLQIPGDVSAVGNYSAIVANAYGSETSQVARLSLGPVITRQPESQTVFASSNVLFTVEAIACAPARYQWRFNGQNIPNGTNGSLYYLSPDVQHEGDYTVVVSDNFRSVTSAVARLTVLTAPIQITLQPRSYFQTFETNLFFNVDFTGSPRPWIQWRKDGVDLPEATNRFLRVLAYPWNQGAYSVVLSNAANVVTSQLAYFTLPLVPPEIYRSPEGRSFCPEVTYEFPPYLYVGATAVGITPIYYQWAKEGVPIPGATNSVLDLSSLAAPFGFFTVLVSNYAGTIWSEPAVVNYASLIKVISIPPTGQAVMEGEEVLMQAVIDACGPYLVQWQKDGVNLPGATNDTLSIQPVTKADAGRYTVLVGWRDTTNSIIIELQVEQSDPYFFDPFPFDNSVNAGELVTLYLQFERGYPPADLQWHFNGRPIAGATNDLLEIHTLSPAQQGRYSATLSNVNTVVTSRQARVQIFFSPPIFDTEPEDILSLIDGATIGFYAYAYGAPPPAYQWLFNGVPLPGSTNDFLGVRFVSTNQAGGYSVIASNFLGSVTSRVATLTAELHPPVFISEPEDQTILSGESVFLNGYATGSPTPFYQWLFNGVPIPGANQPALRFQVGYSNQIGGYSVVASNFLGIATSRVAQVNIIIPPPEFVVHPVGQQLVAGETLYLGFALSNRTLVHVQWQKDGGNLVNATNYDFRLHTASSNDTGDYRVIVWNDAGLATSRVARVEVREPGPLDRWSWRHSLPQGNNLAQSAFGNGRHVIIGEWGAVVISTNGSDWTDVHKSGHQEDRQALAYGNGVFVTIESRFRQFQFSTNGSDWFDSPFPNVPGFGSVTFGNGRFLAGPSDRSMATSTNGIDWEVLELSGAQLGISEEFSDQWYLSVIHFTHDRFIAGFTVISPFFESHIAVSTNGTDWQRATVFNPAHASLEFLYGFAYGNGTFVGVNGYESDVLLSTNGLDWTVAQPPAPLPYWQRGIAFGNGRFVITGYQSLFGLPNNLVHSLDGLIWTPVASISNTFQGLRFQNNLFVAVGIYGQLLTSANGLDWTEHNPGSDLNIRGLTRADGLFVAVGNEGLIYTSTDGRAWVRRDAGTNINLRAVTHFQGRYIAVGEQSDEFPSERITILTSADAIHWQPVPSLGDAIFGNFFSLAHNDHTVVAVGDAATVVFSNDGLNWTRAVGLPTANDLNAVTWNGHVFHAAGKNGTVLASADATNWFTLGPGGGRNLHGIAYGNGALVAVGNSGRYYVGQGDGAWQRGDFQPATDLSDILFAGGRFIAIGDNGTVRTSADGTNWVRRVNPSGNDLRNVIYSEGSYWIVGNNETILQSAQVDAALRIRRIPGSTDVALELLGETGLVHRLQGSHNFIDWTDLLTFTAGPEPHHHRTADPNAGGWRFYRTVHQ